MGHVLRKDKDDWVRRSMEMVIEGKRGVRRPRMTWVKAVESDMRAKGIMREDAEDRTKWRPMSWGAKRLTPTIVGKIASKRLLLLFFVAVHKQIAASEKASKTATLDDQSLAGIHAMGEHCNQLHCLFENKCSCWLCY